MYCSAIIVSINSCTEMHNSKNHHKYYGNNNHGFHNVIEEYMSRVGKRLLIVNDNNKINSSNINFSFNNSDTTLLTIEYYQKSIYQYNTITLTKGVLNYLQDEAELAAILAISLETINSNDIANFDLSAALNADKRIIMHLYKAGYDPSAFVELEEEYLKDKNSQDNWLNFLFSPMNITTERINANKKILLKIPKGLLRGKQPYLSNMYLLKK